MKKKIIAACAIMIFSTASFGCAAENNSDKAADKVEKVPAAVTAEVSAANDSSAQTADNKFSIGGIYPGMSFDEVKKILGEPSNQKDDDEFIFSNGLIVEIKKFNNTVESIKIRQSGVTAGAGVAVGMTEQDLLKIYGNPDAFNKDDGETEYKYYSSDRKYKIEFEIKGGIISNIKSELKD